MTTETAQKATHTPGPWKYMRSGRSDAMMGRPGWNPDDPSHLAHAIYSATYRVARCPDPWFGCPEDETAANARLLAAAPDLLAACKLSLRNVESIIYHQPAKIEDTVELKSLRTWRDTLRAAIEKAGAADET